MDSQDYLSEMQAEAEGLEQPPLKKVKVVLQKPVKVKKKQWRASAVLLTIFDKTWMEHVKEVFERLENIRYIVGQEELTPETKRWHLQIYVQFTKRCQSLKKAKEWCCTTSNVDIAFGSDQHNENYCSKDEALIEKLIEEAETTMLKNKFRDWRKKGLRIPGTKVFRWGTRADIKAKTSTRVDLEAVQKALEAGGQMYQVAKENFPTWIKYHRAFDKYKSMCDKRNSPHFREVSIEVIWGDAGAGKSRRAMEKALKKARDDYAGDYYRPVINTQGKMWFDGYEGEKTIILDDFYGQCRFSWMLKLLDGQRMQVEVKGGMVWAQWDRIIITSNSHPDDWWNNYSSIPKRSLPGFRRRVKKITKLELNDGKQFANWVQETVLTIDKTGKIMGQHRTAGPDIFGQLIGGHRK